MVRVDVQIALGLHGQVKHAVTRDLVEHVIEERHAGRELGATRAVQIHRDGDRRLFRGPLDAGAPAGGGGSAGLGVVHRQSSMQAASNKSFSSGVPTVIRRQFASSGCQR